MPGVDPAVEPYKTLLDAFRVPTANNRVPTDAAHVTLNQPHMTACFFSKQIRHHQQKTTLHTCNATRVLKDQQAYTEQRALYSSTLSTNKHRIHSLTNDTSSQHSLPSVPGPQPGCSCNQWQLWSIIMCMAELDKNKLLHQLGRRSGYSRSNSRPSTQHRCCCCQRAPRYCRPSCDCCPHYCCRQFCHQAGQHSSTEKANQTCREGSSSNLGYLELELQALESLLTHNAVLCVLLQPVVDGASCWGRTGSCRSRREREQLCGSWGSRGCSAIAAGCSAGDMQLQSLCRPLASCSNTESHRAAPVAAGAAA